MKRHIDIEITHMERGYWVVCMTIPGRTKRQNLCFEIGCPNRRLAIREAKQLQDRFSVSYELTTTILTTLVLA